MIRLYIAAGLVWLLAGIGAAGTVDGETGYDLLFRTGTLDKIDRADALVYSREVASRLAPDAAARDTGMIALNIAGGDAPVARLTLRQGEKSRGLGTFPASVGNPMIMYFYESVVRDMAEAAGGSPFYIRNRVKNALISPAEMVAGQETVDGRIVETTTIRLRPFEADPNRDRMKGFGDLVLSVTMSDAVPGWYLRLTAEAADTDGPVYTSTMQFKALEAAQ